MRRIRQGSLAHVAETGDGPPALMATKFALLGWQSVEPAPLSQPLMATVRCALVLHNGKLSRANGERFLPPPATTARRALTGYATTAPRCSRTGPILGAKPPAACGWLGKITARTTADGEYSVRSLEDPGPICREIWQRCSSRSCSSWR